MTTVYVCCFISNTLLCTTFVHSCAEKIPQQSSASSSPQQWDSTLLSPQMTVGGASCDWEAEWKKPHSLPFVGLRTSWTMWHQTFLGFLTKKKCLSESGAENTSCHSCGWMGGDLSNRPIRECDRLVFRGGMWCEEVTEDMVSIRIYCNYNRKTEYESVSTRVLQAPYLRTQCYPSGEKNDM